MQEKLSSIYNELYQLLIQQDIIDSSTSMNSLEFSDMLDLLKHAFISINSEVIFITNYISLFVFS